MRPKGPRDPLAGPDTGPEPPYPLRLEGQVIQGFGRGSKELGIPTANIPIDGLDVAGHKDLTSGVYYGWAGLESLPPGHGTRPESKSDGTSSTPANSSGTGTGQGRVFPMVMSIGWNPYYKNTVRSVEVHILEKFSADFYGARLKLLITGFIRPEYDYESVEALVEDINLDCDVARNSLKREAYERLRGEEWLLDFQ